MSPRGRTAIRRPARLALRDDDRGSFIVLEAILVALLVLTAILFLTTVQRPSTGADQGGIDLGQVAADTLAILEVRSIEDKTIDEWIDATAAGDAATVAEVQEFLAEVLPTGARFAIRLDNGLGNLTLVTSPGTIGTPHGARAAQVMGMLPWDEFRGAQVGPGLSVMPGEVLAPGHPLVSGTYQCYEAPTGATTAPDGPDAGTAADPWASRWTADPVANPTASVPWKSSSAILGGQEQVPRDLPLGRWKVSTGAEVAGACTAGTVTYANVAPGPSKTVTLSTTALSNTFTVTAGSLTTADVGKTLVRESGANVLASTVRVASPTTMSAPASAPGGSVTVTVSPDSSYMPYALQLVVWFGA